MYPVRFWLTTACLLLACHADAMDVEAFASELERAAELNISAPWPESQEILDELRPHLDIATDAQRARFAYLDIRNQTLSGDLVGALDRVHEVLDRDLPAQWRLRLLRLGANIAVLARRFEDTFSLLGAALDSLARDPGDHRDDEGVYSLASYVYTRVGQVERGLEYGRRAARLAERFGDARDRCIAMQRVGYAFKQAQRFDEARDWYDRSLPVCRRSGDELITGVNEAGFADLLRMLGELEASAALFDSAIAKLEQSDFESGLAEARLYRARLARERNDADRTVELLNRSLEQFEREENWDYLAESHQMLAEIERERDNPYAALRHFDSYMGARERHMNMERARQLSFLEVDFDLRAKDQQLALLDERARVSELEAETQRQRVRLTIIGYAIVFALMIGLALLLLRASRERRRFRGLSQIDGLTGVANHTRFFELAERAFERTRETSRPFTLVLADIDYFKQINDRYGHPAGDQVLGLVGARLGQCFGSDAIIGRIGGEEFGVALAGVESSTALDRIEEFREALTSIRADDQPVTVTMSFGIALRRDDESLMSLRERADQALYRAKHGGRDRTVVAGG